VFTHTAPSASTRVRLPGIALNHDRLHAVVTQQQSVVSIEHGDVDALDPRRDPVDL
jgi:hypothetical protein